MGTQYVLVEYRLRKPAIGPFAFESDAAAHMTTLGKGWHIVPIEQPAVARTDANGRHPYPYMDTPEYKLAYEESKAADRELMALEAEHAGEDDGFPHEFGQPCDCFWCVGDSTVTP